MQAPANLVATSAVHPLNYFRLVRMPEDFLIMACASAYSEINKQHRANAFVVPPSGGPISTA
jgi:hypothetical protein